MWVSINKTICTNSHSFTFLALIPNNAIFYCFITTDAIVWPRGDTPSSTSLVEAV